MRNKILVLVLALVCLLSVSALAADITEKFTQEQQDDLWLAYSELIKDTTHERLQAQKPQNWTTYGSNYVVVEYTVADECGDKNASLTYVCKCDKCKEDGFDVAAKNGTLVGKKLPAISTEIKPAHVTDTAKGNNGLQSMTAPTCAKEGSRVWYCVEGHTFTEKIPAINVGHMNSTADQDANVDGYQNPWYEMTHVEATCQNAETTTYTCVYCKEVVQTVVGAAKKNHSYVDQTSVVTEIATCLQPGKTVSGEICKWCKASNPEKPATVTTAPQIKHNDNGDADLFKLFDSYLTKTNKKNAAGLLYVNVEGLKNLTVNATETVSLPAVVTYTAEREEVVQHGGYTLTYVKEDCVNDGSVTIKCENCGDSLKFAVKATNHKPQAIANTPIMDDCTESYNIAYKCEYCQENFQEVIPGNIEHKADDWVDGFVQYQNNGVIKAVYKVTDWDENDGSVLAYQLVSTTGSPVLADCLPYYEVNICGAKIGNTTYYCENEELVEVAATAKHSTKPAEGKGYYINDAASCAKSGLQVYACAECGDTVTKTIPVLADHGTGISKWSIDVQPECGKEGTASAVCTICKQPVVKTIPALVHKMEINEELSVKLDSEKPCVPGKIVKTCDNCSAVEETIIEAKHSVAVEDGTDKPLYTKYAEASCSKEGSATFTCTVCKNEISITIPKLPHKMVAKFDEDGKRVEYAAECCLGGYYVTYCENCGTEEPVFTSAAKGHADLTAQDIADIKADALAGTLPSNIIVKNAITCTDGAVGTKICNEDYVEYVKNSKGVYVKTEKNCVYEYNFSIPAAGHDWKNAEVDPKTGELVIKCKNCDVVETIATVKPEYEVKLDGTKGKVVLKNELATRLTTAWVRISYGFELSDGSYLAMTTCMPITFDAEGNGSFSFFALNTSLESTGVNIMVVDQYDAMYKTIGELVGNNYGMYIG